MGGPPGLESVVAPARYGYHGSVRMEPSRWNPLDGPVMMDPANGCLVRDEVPLDILS